MIRATRWLLVLLALSGIYLYGFPAPNIPFAVAVLGHILGGIALVVLAALLARRFPGLTRTSQAGWVVTALGGATGLALIVTGATLPNRPLLYAHIALSTVGFIVLAGDWLGRRLAGPSAALGPRLGTFALVVVVVGVAAAGAWYQREVRWQQAYRITNPTMPPASMDEEGHGRQGPFFPSSNRTTDGQLIKADYFMESQACERCHGDVYKQWFSSAHHLASFNNQWYRKSIEYMQELNGVESTKWCGGCHDPALMFSGLMNTPIKDIVHTPEAQAGLGCVACHSIVEVDSTMGQGGYTIHYPKLNDLANSEQPAMRWLHDFLVKVNPEPHRRAFMKPFMTNEQSSEFCSTCHKVHLDVPVNNYRWIRGFNDYDNWQASGVSGQGARSFYYPSKPSRCVDCHMPKVQSNDFGNKYGFVSSHRFPAANTALPTVNDDAEQLEVTKAFLQNDIVSVDIFAIGPSLGAIEHGAMVPGGELSTTFAVGEEGSMDSFVPQGAHREAAPITAPLDRTDPTVRRGDTVRVDVVVRTKKVGHFFPGGTVDAFDVWLELQAIDEKGQMLFWSGKVEDDGKGPVEPGAHFYRSLMVDERGNPINKRNAWATRALVYVRLIPPGAADTVHYRLEVPDHAGETITLKAKLHYRKFAWYNTQWAYAGIPDPSVQAEFSAHFDDRPFIFTGDVSNVSGKMKAIPDVPIVTLAEDEATLRVLPRDAAEPEPKAVLLADDWMRWNDYGIGLLLQGDLKGAEAAFLRVTEIAPDNPDGWVNIGRARVAEGDVEGAREVLEKALAISPTLARALYFMSRVERAEGEIEAAIATLEKVVAQYPRDRVVRNDLGRNYFLMRRFADAVKEFETTLSIDPEDVTAHYNLMLSYNGLRQPERSQQHQARYMRFKADESAQAITGPYRLRNPDDNRERQAIHEHVSVALDPPPARRSLTKGAPKRDGTRAQAPAGTRAPVLTNRGRPDAPAAETAP
jgi:Flp pilus assembly protein TadD